MGRQLPAGRFGHDLFLNRPVSADGQEKVSTKVSRKGGLSPFRGRAASGRPSVTIAQVRPIHKSRRCFMVADTRKNHRVEMNQGLLIATAGLFIAATVPASAQPAAEFYRGKTINLLVGSGEGGGFDLSARLSAPYLSRYIPGNPTIIVQNMPGASGLRAAEYIFNVAPRDGTVIAIKQPSIVQHKVLTPAARFDPREYNWIGRLGGFVTYGVVWHTAPAQTIEEARQREIILGAVGPSGPGAMLPAALNQLAGTKFAIVKGYKSAADMG